MKETNKAHVREKKKKHGEVKEVLKAMNFFGGDFK